MTKNHIALALLSLASSAAIAQVTPDPPPKLLDPSTWTMAALRAGSLITLRQSSQDANNNTKPALLQWTENNNGKDSFAVDAALQAPLASTDFSYGRNQGVLIFSPLAEYHRSTVTKKEVDTSAAGITFDWVGTYVPERSRDPDQVPEAGTDHLAKFSLAYKNDRLSKGQGIQGGLSYGLRSAAIGSAAIHGKIAERLYVDPTTNQIDETRLRRALLPWEWMPYIAVQGEHADGLKDDGGEVYRGKFSASAAAYPFSTVIDYPIALTADYAGWWNVSKSGIFDSYSHYQKQFVAGIQWTVLSGLDRNAGGQYSVSADGNAVVSIALQYYAGANPEEGKPSQSYTQLTLKLRL